MNRCTWGARACRLLMLLVVALVIQWRPAAAVTTQRVEAGGIEAWLVEDRSNPVIALSFAFRGGSALDPAGKEGLAQTAMALLDEGAGPYDAQAFKERLEDLAIRLSFDADRDSVGGLMQTLSDNREAAFQLLRQAVTQPRFAADAVARVKSQLEAYLRQQNEDPEQLASRKFFAEMFPDAPYGRPVEGTLASIGRISAADLRKFAAERLARGNLVIGVVGDITPSDLGQLLTKTFGPLPAVAKQGEIAAVKANASGGVAVIDLAVPQSAIVFGQQGIKRSDPAFYAATVLNQVLGGSGLTSLLFDEVREKRGLVYSVYSALAPLEHAALWLGGAGTANDRVAETVKVVRDVWGQVASEGVTAAQVADAKTYLTGSFPLRFTSSAKIAQLLVATQLERLGIDYLNQRNGLIEAVTTDQVNTLAREALKPEALTFVVVGQPRGLKPTR